MISNETKTTTARRRFAGHHAEELFEIYIRNEVLSKYPHNDYVLTCQSLKLILAMNILRKPFMISVLLKQEPENKF